MLPRIVVVVVRRQRASSTWARNFLGKPRRTSMYVPCGNEAKSRLSLLRQRLSCEIILFFVTITRVVVLAEFLRRAFCCEDDDHGRRGRGCLDVDDVYDVCLIVLWTTTPTIPRCYDGSSLPVPLLLMSQHHRSA
jgi:hypothetical protein